MSTIDYMNECTVRDLVLMLMEERGLSLHEALDTVYNSETYAKLRIPQPDSISRVLFTSTAILTENFPQARCRNSSRL